MNRIQSRTVVAVLCAALGATGLTGCGSSGQGGSGGAPTVSQFKAQANAICAAGNADIKKIGAGISSTSSQTAVVTALHQAANRANREVSDIRKLTIPASIAHDVGAFLASVNTATAKILAGGIAVLSGPDPFIDADAKAKALGLTRCESGSGT